MGQAAEVYELLRSREVNLSTVSMFAGILTDENREDLLARVGGKSSRQVEEVVSLYRPRKALKDRIKPVAILKETSTAGTSEKEPGCSLFSGFGERQATPPASPPEKEPEQRYAFGFSVGKSFRDKFEKVKSMMSGKFPTGASIEQVLEVALDEYIDRNDPRRRAQRRSKRKEKSKQSTGTKEKRKETRTRHIPAAVRDEVFMRDKGRCTYVGPDARECGSTWDLEIDHEEPFAQVRDHSPAGLRLRCRAHNVLEAGKAYGRKFMDKFSRSTAAAAARQEEGGEPRGTGRPSG